MFSSLSRLLSFLQRVLPGGVPRLLRYYKEAPSPDAPSDALRFRLRCPYLVTPHFSGSCRSLPSLPVRRLAPPPCRAWSLLTRLLPPASSRGEHQISQVPRRALYEHAPLFDPGPVRSTRFSVSDCCLPLGANASASGPHPLFRGSITQPVHSLCTLHSTGHPAKRNTRFQPGTTLCWTGFVPVGSR